MKIGVQEVYEGVGVTLETTLLRSGRSGTGQKENVNCNRVATGTSADPTGGSGAYLALRIVPYLEEGSWTFVFLNPPEIRGGPPCGGGITLGKQLLSAEGNV